MSFDKDRWSRQSVALNTGLITLDDASRKNGPAIFTYANNADTIDDLVRTGANYFADAAYDLAANDLIFAYMADGYASLRVSSVTRDGDNSAVAVASAPLSGVNPVQTISVSLTSAEILALRAAPKELVPAPGNDQVLQFLGAMLVLDYGTVQYTEAGDNLAIKYTDGSGVAVSQTIETTGFIDQAADTLTNAEPVINAIVAATGAVNQPLVLHNIGAAEFLAGDSTMLVNVSYKAIDANLA